MIFPYCKDGIYHKATIISRIKISWIPTYVHRAFHPLDQPILLLITCSFSKLYPQNISFKVNF